MATFLFVNDNVLLIKIIQLKFLQRDDAYGECELYGAHLWQVNNYDIFSLTFAYIALDEMSFLRLQAVQHTLKI